MTADPQAYILKASASRVSGERGDATTSRTGASRVSGFSGADRAALVRLANRFVWNGEDAEDVVQDALLAAESSREQLRDASRAGAWLRRIVVQKALVHRRRAQVRQRWTDSVARIGPDPAPGPAESASTREQRAALRDAIGRLPGRQRVAITLRHLEGMGYAEMAELMEIGETTVRFHVRQARLALVRMMGDPG